MMNQNRINQSLECIIGIRPKEEWGKLTGLPDYEMDRVVIRLYERIRDRSSNEEIKNALNTKQIVNI